MSGNVVVGIDTGLLRGRVSDGVAVFKGIRYGEAVAGRRRWRRCAAVTPWDGVRDALEYGPRAIQLESRQMKVTSDELEALMAAGGPADDRWTAQSEECLTLSVWTPDVSPARKLPVMFWCHGGNYFGETPPVWWFDGENLSRDGSVVVVTVRHRVGALGFLHLADLPGGAGYEEAGNVGMLDLVSALAWVRRNVASFGGDAGNVTIFGESGGGRKVSVLLGMPDAHGLFQKAIIQSGAQLVSHSRHQGTETAIVLMAELGLRDQDVSSLLEVSTERLAEAQLRLASRLRPANEEGLVGFEPIADGSVQPGSPFDPVASAVCKDVPLIVGTCATETTFFLSSIPRVFELSDDRMRGMLRGIAGPHGDRLIDAYAASRPGATPTELFFAITTDLMMRRKAVGLAERKTAQGGAPVYMYVLEFETDVHGGKYRTPHILDLPLVFAHPDHPILGSNPARHLVSRQMSGAWAAFAQTGDPNIDLLPHWPAYDTASRATMYFGDPAHLAPDPRAEERAAWQDVG